MQVYPGHGGGFAYRSIDDDDFFCMDDYHYNNGFPHGESMKMAPNQYVPLPKQNTTRYCYKDGSGMQISRPPDQWIPRQSHNYHRQMDGYPVYDQKGARYPDQVWSGNEPCYYNPWNDRNGGPVRGGYSGSMSPDDETSGGGGRRLSTPIYEQRPYYSEQNKAPPVWVNRCIVD